MTDTATDTIAKPAFVTDDHLEFLDDLRASGKTNMFGARPYVKKAFKMLTDDQARDILLYWMKTFKGSLCPGCGQELERTSHLNHFRLKHWPHGLGVTIEKRP